MFQLSTSQLIAVLRFAVGSVPDPKSYFKVQVGTCAPHTKNTLLGRTGAGDSTQTTLTSAYVGCLLSMKIGADVLPKSFFNSPCLKGNRSVEGWFFEAKFFCLIACSDGQVIPLSTILGKLFLRPFLVELLIKILSRKFY